MLIIGDLGIEAQESVEMMRFPWIQSCLYVASTRLMSSDPISIEISPIITGCSARMSASEMTEAP